jgi:hypothetical protein
LETIAVSSKSGLAEIRQEWKTFPERPNPTIAVLNRDVVPITAMEAKSGCRALEGIRIAGAKVVASRGLEVAKKISREECFDFFASEVSADLKEKCVS